MVYKDKYNTSFMDLLKIDLGKDEAESDVNLNKYFLRTGSYQKAKDGRKTLVVGRKGSGKSAILTLLQSESNNVLITPDQYSWSALKDYKEIGILPEQAHTNAWKLTLLSSIIWKMKEDDKIQERSKLNKYYAYLNENFRPEEPNKLLLFVDKAKKLLRGVKTPYLEFDSSNSSVPIPLQVNEELKKLILTEWTTGYKLKILVDRLDDSWDASKESETLLIGLLKAMNELNSFFKGNVLITVFIRSDIYDNLYFDDQDKLRQYEERIYWDIPELKKIIIERIKFSLNLGEKNDEEVWNELFSEKRYRSRAKAEKYITDRTFKRPRDMISFVRFCIETAINNHHEKIETKDTRLAEQEKYSESKFKDLIIEYKKTFPYIKELLENFSGSSHKISIEELSKKIEDFFQSRPEKINVDVLIKNLFVMGFIGIKRMGHSGVKQRGGVQFYYYYDDPSINPLTLKYFYIHPALRWVLNIKETRE